jgi:Response regulator containing CheY-like receiver domain and AraC-type DNA-binding domain
MYQVLIADDEPSVVHSLLNSINWDKYHLNITGLAASGSEALLILQNRHVDIAILDIRMPGLSGIELSEVIHQSYPHIRIIIISGYAEFSYAHKAIQNGAIGYCLKPLDYDEIRSLLFKTVNLLNSGSQKANSDDLLDAMEADNIDLIKKILEQFDMRQEYYYTAVSICNKPIVLPYDSGITFSLGRNQYGYLMKSPLNKVQIQNLSMESDHRCIGISSTPVSPNNLKNSLNNCSAYAYQFFIDECCKVCYGTNNTTASLFLSEISKAVSLSHKQKLIELLCEFKEADYKSIFNIRSALQLCNTIFTSDFFHDAKYDYYVYSFDQLVSEYGDFKCMLSILIDLLKNTKEAFHFASVNNATFLTLMKYINNHYNEQISLTETASALHMNPNYMSQMFKKETGITLTHYITNLRISEAKKQLTTTDTPISDISIYVGFNDYFYFLKTFKKVTGKTPSQYRQWDKNNP